MLDIVVPITAQGLYNVALIFFLKNLPFLLKCLGLHRPGWPDLVRAHKLSRVSPG